MAKDLKKRTVLYTVLIGRYEKLNELETVDPDVRSICLTDDPELTSSSWETVLVEPAFPSDSIRSQRLLKILGHRVLEEYDQWLYIDNSVRLTEKPSSIIEAVLRDFELAIPIHSFRSTVLDEFEAVIEDQLDSVERIEEQRLHYLNENIDSLSKRPLWTAIIARKNSAGVAQWAEKWAQHVLRYSRRDQLSIGLSLEKSGLRANLFEIDNFKSTFHEWPILNDRKIERRTSSDLNYGFEVLGLRAGAAKLSESLKVLQDELVRLKTENTT